MRHDFAAQPNSEETERFRKWLDTETTGMLQRSYGDSEKTEAAIFLFCQRAYEGTHARKGNRRDVCTLRPSGWFQ
jgi:hypothetical protein